MIFKVDGPGVSGSISVTDSTSVEAKVGASVLPERKIISIQPMDGRIYYSFTSPASDTNGTYVFKRQIVWLEIGPQLPVYLIADSGTVDVRISEVA